MSVFLPKDEDNAAVPAVRLKQGGAHQISATDTAARNNTAFDAKTRLVSVYATGPVFIKFGDGSVTATTSDHYFPEGIYYDFAIGGEKVPHLTHLSVIRADADCAVYISEKE